MDEQTKIALIEQKIDSFATILSKLDNTIEKLSEVNSNVIKMLAVHEEKVAQAEKSDEYIMKLIEEANKRVDSVEQELKDIQKTRWMTLGIGAILVIVISVIGEPVINRFFSPSTTPPHTHQPTP